MGRNVRRWLPAIVGGGLLLLISGCNITYIVRLDGVDLYGRLELPCGAGKVYLQGRGKRQFSFWQIYRLERATRYHADNIEARVNRIRLPVESFNRTRNTGKGRKEFMVHDGDTVVSSFFIPEGVFEEDTIVVKTTALLDCAGKPPAEEARYYFYFKRNEFIRIR